MKENLKRGEVYQVLDFSQNYNAKYSLEIHYPRFGASKKQISRQTGGYFFKNSEDKLVFKYFSSTSDCLRHDSSAAWVLLIPAIKTIKQEVPDLCTLHIQSDGPATQYKNKTNFFFFQYFCKKFEYNNASWNFTVAVYDKREADGIEENLKDLCDRIVVHGKVIYSADKMVTAINEYSKIRAFLVDEEEIKKIEALIPNNEQRVKETMAIHQVIWVKKKEYFLYFRYLSCSECISHQSCKNFPIRFTIKINSYNET